MEPIGTATIINISGCVEEQIAEINEKVQEPSFVQGNSYLFLGFTGMQDGVVVVSEYGRVFHLPNDEDCIEVKPFL